MLGFVWLLTESVVAATTKDDEGDDTADDVTGYDFVYDDESNEKGNGDDEDVQESDVAFEGSGELVHDFLLSLWG